jgi:hypothetical protein
MSQASTPTVVLPLSGPAGFHRVEGVFQPLANDSASGHQADDEGANAAGNHGGGGDAGSHLFLWSFCNAGSLSLSQ